MTSWLLLGLLLLGIAFAAVCAGAYFGLDRVARARLEHEAEEDPDAVGMGDVLKSPRALRGALDLLGGASRAGLTVTVAVIAADALPGPALSPGLRVLALWAGVFVVAFFLGELSARTLAARHAEALTRVLSGPLGALVRLTFPVRALAARLLPQRARALAASAATTLPGETPGAIDEEEFRELVDESTEAGVVQAQERALIHKVLDFGDKRVREVMTPFERVFALPQSTPVEAAAAAIAERKYSRVPLYDGEPERIVGVLHAKDLLAIRWGVREARPLARMARKPLYVVPHMRAQALLESFKRHRLHMAVVTDEHGAALGLCTMEDLLEELVGPITDVAAERKGEEGTA